jgi:hypothetical protein
VLRVLDRADVREMASRLGLSVADATSAVATLDGAELGDEACPGGGTAPPDFSAERPCGGTSRRAAVESIPKLASPTQRRFVLSSRPGGDRP